MPLCKDGYWREWKSHEGKQYCGIAKNVDLKKAQQAAMLDLAKKITDAKNGTTILNSNTTVKVWVKTWLETYVKDSDITDKSYANIKGKVERNIVDAIGTMKLKDVKEAHLQKIMNAQKGMSISHVDKLRQYMNRIFKKAVKSKLIPSNPAEDLELPKASNKTHRPITATEREAILKTAQTHRAGLWVKTMLYCGARPGETIPLQWRDIDFKNKTLNIHQALESGTTDKIKGPKSEAGYRIVPIPDCLMPDFIANKGNPLEYIFTQVKTENSGKHHTESSLRCYWKSFIRDMDISLGAEVKRNQIIKSKIADDLVPYCLRHTYGTDLQNAGVQINVAKYLMGHEDIATTANIYTHESDDIVKQAAVLINSYGTTTPTTKQKSRKSQA